MEVDPAHARGRRGARRRSSARSGRSPRRRGCASSSSSRRARRRSSFTDEQRARAGAAQPALQRDEVHRAAASCGWRSSRPRRARPRRPPVRGGVHGQRHRHRHRRGQAAADLRGLPAGRRHDQPPLRRHRPRACRSSARSRACSAARSAARVDRGRGVDVHACCCRRHTPPQPVLTQEPSDDILEALSRRADDRDARPPSPARATARRRWRSRSPTTARRSRSTTDVLLVAAPTPTRRLVALDRVRAARLQGDRGGAAPATRSVARGRSTRRRAIVGLTAPSCSGASSTTRARATCRCWPSAREAERHDGAGRRRGRRSPRPTRSPKALAELREPARRATPKRVLVVEDDDARARRSRAR